MIGEICLCFQIKYPKRNINTFDLVDMVLLFENTRQKLFAFEMFPVCFFCLFFVFLRWNDIIRS